MDVGELCSDNSYLSAILDRQGLMFAPPADQRTKKAEGFSPQALQSIWSKIKLKNPKIVVMSHLSLRNTLTKGGYMATLPICAWRTRVRKDLVFE